MEWQRFTGRARQIVLLAQEKAQKLGSEYVCTEHLLLGIIDDKDCKAAEVLTVMGVSLTQLRTDIEQRITLGNSPLSQDMQLTPRAKCVIDLAYDEARQFKHNYIGTEHLLLGLTRESGGLAARMLQKSGVELEQLRAGVRQHLYPEEPLEKRSESTDTIKTVSALLKRVFLEKMW